MKKALFLFLSICILLSGCTTTTTPKQNNTIIKTKEIAITKSIWITYYELSSYTKGKTEKEFRASIEKLFNELKDFEFNTVTVQVRPCADAFYNSKYFPTSIYFNGTQGEAMLYDPLKIICDIGKKYNLSIEAWINPYRVSQNSKLEELCSENVAKKWIKHGSNKVVLVNKKYYFNPAYDEVTKLIKDGVAEIVKNYDVAAIHFDDYFYPSKDKIIDKNEFKAYQKNGGTLSLDDWRRENVSNMIRQVYKTIKRIDQNILFGISPASNIENDKNVLYADVEKWVNKDGYIDYICPQIYFGFKNIYQPFMQTTKKWVKLCDDKKTLYIGLPLYKAGNVDKYAAEFDKSIKNEFVNNDNIIARQINYISKIGEIKGYYIFSLSSLKSEKAKNEVSNMLSTMQSNNPD